MNIVSYRNWETTNDAKFVGFWVSFSDVELQLTTWLVAERWLAVTTDPHWSVMMMIALCLFVDFLWFSTKFREKEVNAAESKENEKLG